MPITSLGPTSRKGEAHSAQVKLSIVASFKNWAVNCVSKS